MNDKNQPAEANPVELERSRLLEQVAEHRAAVETVAAERARFYALLMDIPAGIILLRGTELVAELANPMYHAMIGRKEGDIVGKKLLEFLPEFAGQGFVELLLGVIETGKPFIGHEVPARVDTDGSGTLRDVWYTFIYQPVHESDGTRSGVFVHVVDVSEHVLARRALHAEIQERKLVEERLQAEIRERAQTEEELRAKFDIIQRQEEAILVLAVPILQIWDGVLALPVVGTVDSGRAGRMMEGLLDAITRTRAHFAIIDLTGVDIIDSSAADHLLKIVRAAGLLGSRCLVSGVSPQMAQTIVGLNLGLNEFMSFNTLESALRYAIQHLGSSR
jgi:rsbT co-antagonist protein RsbR